MPLGGVPYTNAGDYYPGTGQVASAPREMAPPAAPRMGISGAASAAGNASGSGSVELVGPPGVALVVLAGVLLLWLHMDGSND